MCIRVFHSVFVVGTDSQHSIESVLVTGAMGRSFHPSTTVLAAAALAARMFGCGRVQVLAAIHSTTTKVGTAFTTASMAEQVPFPSGSSKRILNIELRCCVIIKIYTL